MTRRLLLAALFVAIAAPAFAQPEPYTPQDGYWGASWTLGKSGGLSYRPKDFAKTATAVAVSGGGPVGVSAVVWGDVGDIQTGHEYELRYQLRLHTKKGETGPVLGTKDFPDGVAPVLAKGTAGEKWNGLQGSADIVRKELTGMTGLPGDVTGFRTVFLRVEPQVYDATEKKYVTEAKTTAAVLVVEVGPARRVYSVQTLAEWVREHDRLTERVVEALGGLDAYDAKGSGVVEALLPILGSKYIEKGEKLKLVAAVPAECGGKNASHELTAVMNEWAKGDDAELKAAAKKVLGEK